MSKLESYYHIKEKENLQEYIFMSQAGYRHFFMLGKDLADAEANFNRLDSLARKGFTLEDLPVRLAYDQEKCKDWKIEDFWKYNENKHLIINNL